MQLTGTSLTLQDIEAISIHGETVALADEAKQRVKQSHQVVEDILARSVSSTGSIPASAISGTW